MKYETITSDEGELTKNKAESDGTEINYKKEANYTEEGVKLNYKSKINYEGTVTSTDETFERDSREGEPNSQAIGDAKYTVSPIPEEEYQQKGAYEPDDEYTKGCYYLEDKKDGEKYQIKANTLLADYKGIVNYQVTDDRITDADLGLYKREQPDVSVANDIEQVKLNINGKQYTYQYGAKTSKENIGNLFNDEDVGVKFQSKNTFKYRREVYPSDVEIVPNHGEELEVHVIYKTAIRNESSTLKIKPTEIVSYYDKEYQTVTDVTGDIVTENTKEQEGRDGVSVYWNYYSHQDNVGSRVSHTSYGTHKERNTPEGLDIAYGQVSENAYIEPGRQMNIYTDYKLSRQQALALIGGAIETGDKQIENEDGVEVLKFYNYIEINSFTTHLNSDNTPYAGIDSDSTPGNAIPNIEEGKEGTYEDDNDEAPVFQLALKNNNSKRIIKGNVFEDYTNPIHSQHEDVEEEYEDVEGKDEAEHGRNGKRSDLKESKGDGIEDDNIVRGVTVELLEVNDDGKEFTLTESDVNSMSDTLKDLYEKGSTDVVLDNEDKVLETGQDGMNKNTLREKNPAKIDVKDDGTYEFKGFIPGNYLIKFTWGDGTVSYKKNSNDKVADIDSQQYKGAIFNNEDRYNLTVDSEGKPTKWYMYGEDADTGNDNYSHRNNSNAIDDIGIRYDIDQNDINKEPTTANGNNYLKYTDLKEMDSRTPTFYVNFEEEWEESEDPNDKNDEGNKGFQGSSDLEFKIEEMDFGIVKRPDMNITMDKRVTKLVLRLPNGNILIDTDVKDGKLTDALNTVYLEPSYEGNDPIPKYERKKTHTGSAKIEMDQEIMHGSTLEITYTYTFHNLSDLDYVVKINSGQKLGNDGYRDLIPDKNIGNSDENEDEYFERNTTLNRYYKFGTYQSYDEEVVMEPKVVVDYLSKNMNFLREEEDAPKENIWWERVTKDAQYDAATKLKDYVKGNIYLHRGERMANGSKNTRSYYQSNPPDPSDPLAEEKYYNSAERYQYFEISDSDSVLEDYINQLNNDYWIILRDVTDIGMDRKDEILKEKYNNNTTEINNEKEKAHILLKPSETSDVKFIASKVLGSNNEDLEFYNTAEILQIDKKGGSYIEKSLPGNLEPGKSPNVEEIEKDGNRAEQVTVIPPTGDDTDYINVVWTVIGIISLGVLGTGLVFIRKVVLK